jgi:hypothetical protein
MTGFARQNKWVGQNRKKKRGTDEGCLSLGQPARRRQVRHGNRSALVPLAVGRVALALLRLPVQVIVAVAIALVALLLLLLALTARLVILAGVALLAAHAVLVLLIH